MDSVRHKADSASKYGSYFELLQRKIAEYDVEPEHTYNMDEKGFAIGVVGRSKRIFSKDAYEKKRVTAALQDGNREWVTVLAAVCADGSALPPGIIYPAAGKVVQASWVKDIDPGKHSVHFATSPSGWTNDDIGLAWLEQIFDRYTKPKARRKWRLLIVDGHGSHLTMDFINYCDENKILLAVFPPHSTHTLQPLDVVCFKPLASNYSNALAKRLHNTLGWVPIKKKDFFLLFWEAWESTFTKELILSSFEATGISPLNPNKVLDKFRPTTPETQSSRDSPIPVYSGKDWLKLKSLMRNVAKDVSNKESQRILRSFHHLSAQYELLNHEMQGIKETVVENKKHAAKQRALPLQQHEEWHGGAQFWSPRAKKEAEVRYEVFKRLEHEEERAKADRRQIRIKNKLLNEKLKEERRVEREAAKIVREKEKAEKAVQVAERKAGRERQKQAREAAKDTNLPQNRKRKASKLLTRQRKHARCAVYAVGSPLSAVAPSTPPPKIYSRGRHINRPGRFL